MIALPSTRQIQFLLALHQDGSFHKAAKTCGVTQSTISAAIQEMESILGATLIDRSNRKRILFTPFGLEMIDTGRQVIDRLSDMNDRAQRSSQVLATPLRIGVIPTIAPYLLPQIMRPLQKAFPKITLHIHEMQSDDLIDAVQQGDLDYGLMAFPYDIQNLQQFPLHKEAFFCAGPKDSFNGKLSLTLRDIEKQKLLLLSDGHCLRDHALSACGLKDQSHTQDVSATSLATLIQLVTEGYGVTLLPEMVIRHTPLIHALDILPIIPAPLREIGAIWRKKSSVGNDALALSLAIYRLIQGASVTDDSVNPDFRR